MKTIVNRIQISAITACLPTTTVEMSNMAAEFGEKEVANIINVTGVERARICNSDETASDLCQKAAEHLLRSISIDASSIDGLVFVSQTPDYILPATSILLQKRLGLETDTVCIDIHFGCSGYIYGLFQAACWICAGACKKVLVLAGDTTSKLINPQDKSLRMVFGDGGSATLIEYGTSSMGFSIYSDGSGYDRLIVPAGGFRIPRSEETSRLEYDQDKNGRTRNDLYMDGMAIFNFAISNVHKDIDSLLEKVGWAKEQVELFALHQANAFMVNHIRKKLKVNPDKAPVNVKNYGNTGPSSIPLLLSDILSNCDSMPEKVILSGFGVGLSWGSVACDLSSCKCIAPLNG